MPIKDSGVFSFVSAWAAKVVPMDFWVGLRAQTVTFTIDDKVSVFLPILSTFYEQIF